MRRSSCFSAHPRSSFLTTSLSTSLFASLLASVPVSWLMPVSSAQAAPVAIVDTRLEVGDGTTLEHATIVFDDEKGTILQVMPNMPTPILNAGVTRIDGRGKVLTPGLIEVQTQLGLVEVLLEEQTDDQESKIPDSNGITPAARAIDGFNPLSVRIPISREEGVLTAVVSPKGGLLAGVAFAASLHGTLATQDEKPVAIFGALTHNASASLGNSRSALWLRLRTIFDDARYLSKNRAKIAAGEGKELSLPIEHLEAVALLVEQKIPLVLTANRVSDIQAALRFAEAQKIKLIINGGAEAWLVAADLAKAKVPVIWTPSSQGPVSFETLHHRDDAMTILLQAGVDVIVSTGSDDINIRRLRQEAGIAVAAGATYAQAMRSVAFLPAQAFGLTNLGSISVGKQADFVLWSGDPLEVTTMAERLWIKGRSIDLDNRQLQLAKRYLERIPAANPSPSKP